MRARQGELRLQVIEGTLLPSARLVTVSTGDPKGAFVDILLRVASVTGAWHVQPTVSFLVAAITKQVGVGLHQREPCESVIDRGFPPTGWVVASLTGATQMHSMNVVDQVACCAEAGRFL